MEITRKIVFHAGHMLKDDVSKCHHPHGHEYVVEVTIAGDLKEVGPDTGMVLNFGKLKEVMMLKIHDWLDHKFIIEKMDPRADKFVEAVGEESVIFFDVPPTAENMAFIFAERVQDHFSLVHHYSDVEKVKVTRVKVQETLNCWAVYER